MAHHRTFARLTNLHVHLFIVILVYLRVTGTLGQSSLRDALCPRIFLKISGTSLAQKVLEGVYEMSNDTLNSFPIYYNPATGYMLYSGRLRSRDLFFVGPTTDTYTLQARLIYDIIEWRRWIYHGNQPFQNLILQWYYYTFSDDDPRPVYYEDTSIALVCVSNYVSVCATKQLYLNQTVTQTNNGNKSIISTPHEVYYEEIPGVTKNDRPVFLYKHDSYNAYLYFIGPYWNIGLSNYTGKNIFMRCFSTAWRPEFLDCTWEVYNIDRYNQQPGLGIACKGFAADNDTLASCAAGSRTNSLCEHNAACGVNSLQEVQCFCPHGYSGEKCQNAKLKCDTVDTIEHSQGIITQTKYVGEVVAHICDVNASPKFVLSVCTLQNGIPTRQYSGRCVLIEQDSPRSTTYKVPFIPHRVTSPSSTTSPIPFSFDSVGWVYPLLITVVVILQVILPFITCTIILVKRKRENDKKEAAKPLRRKVSSRGDRSKRQTALAEKTQSVYQEWVETLQEFRNQHPEMSRMSASEYHEDIERGLREINDKYGRADKENEEEKNDLEKEIAESKPQRRFARSLPCGRIFSIHMFVSFWLWFIYLSSCLTFKCGRYGDVFFFLLMAGIFMMPIAYVWVLVESCSSREKKYVTNLGDTEHATTFIDKMRSKCPVVTMTATAWHFEQRTRTVSYTDANGYTQYRTETYCEKVITANICKVFIFNYWIDDSDCQLQGVRERGVTTIKMHCSITFGDEETEATFNEVYNQFQRDTRHLDLWVDYNTNKQVPGFKNHVATYLDKDTVPKWMNKIVYWIAAVIMCTWIFRVAFRKSVSKTEYGVFKRIYMSRPSIENVHTYEDQSAEYNKVEKKGQPQGLPSLSTLSS